MLWGLLPFNGPVLLTCVVHLYSYTLSDCLNALPRCWDQAIKEEDRYGGIRVPEEVIDGFPNFEVGAIMFLKTAYRMLGRSSQGAATNWVNIL